MLKRNDSKKGVVLVGSSSDIGLEILKSLRIAKDTKLITIGRHTSTQEKLLWPYGEHEELFCDLESRESVDEILSKIRDLSEFDLVIFAVGYLPQELSDIDFLDVRKTLRINSEGVILLLSAFANRLTQFGGGKMLLLSSVAASRPRIRNFTYGASKAAADFFAIGLASKYKADGVDIKVLRPGFVFSKMTKGFKPAPFAISIQDVSKIAVAVLRSNRKVAYAPSFLKLLINLLKILPRRLFDSL
jgi:decaprenylphospho-beta-D-erythro-pentofuranosid-2-ulose 2-reductase